MARTIFTIVSQDHPKHQVFWIDHSQEVSSEALESLRFKITDSVDQKLIMGLGLELEKTVGSFKIPELIYFGPGVTDNSAKSFKELLLRTEQFKNQSLEVHSGVLFEQSLKLDFNPLIQRRKILSASSFSDDIGRIDFSLGIETEIKVSEYPLSLLSDEELNALSLKNCWALSLDEMKLIQNHFKSTEVTDLRLKSGLSQHPTDVEIEMLAQTWSEHCKHKIFSAIIDYEDQDGKVQINGLFKEFIKDPTHAMKKSWAISLFDDNAGIVRFREGIDLCIKVETHNSPSALDPYGGALTGILGVNRDIMGTGMGAKPVANTDVFCVGMPDETELPHNLLHPGEILKGIHRGVMDGGNKSGIPTVNGAIYFDESYSGKPLVYCGTVGVLPPKVQHLESSSKNQKAGELIVMVGGEVGIDGIHGATASSLVMDKHTTIGMVQIGDPFSQKRMLDFLLAARDQLLYTSITDNGAGGLSSSVGEMSQLTGGAHLNLEKVPLKYQGLTPWQILVSESQERMTISVSKNKFQELQALADLYQVKISNIGEFKEDGLFTCSFANKLVCQLNLKFLHDGLPKLKLKARHQDSVYKSWKSQTIPAPINNQNDILSRLLSHPTISSKEKWIRQYDHEVQGGSVVKPLEGFSISAPNDAGVLWYGAYGADGFDGFAVASGLCPHFSQDDAKLMATLAVDESVRNLICHGADPDKIALVDNFCWPDPTPSAKNPDAEFKLAQLVRTCMGLKEIIETYSMPLVSGKDSMKNDYHGENLKISVMPTLLVTALGHIPDVRKVTKSQARAGSYLYRMGEGSYQKYFGHFLHKVMPGLNRDNTLQFDLKKTRSFYQRMFTAQTQELLTSIHDLSEGGFMVSLFETLMMNNLGIDIDTSTLLKIGDQSLAYLYSELPGQFIVSIEPKSQKAFEAHFKEAERQLLGLANTTGVIKLDGESLDIKALAKNWRGDK